MVPSAPKERRKGKPWDRDVSAHIKNEFKSADFGDKRLNERLQKIGIALGSTPSESIPKACEDWASTKATYRFCDNENVNPKEILSSHRKEQKSRLKGEEKVLVVSDTTFLTFPRHPSKEGLGDVGDSKTDVNGVLVHSTIGVHPETKRMTGVMDQQILIRDQQSDKTKTYDTNGKGEPIQLKSEGEKWIRGDKRAIRMLPEETRPIFIHDREADDFSLYTGLKDEDSGFVIRASQNRCIRTPSGRKSHLFDWSKKLPEVGRTEIHVQQRRGRKSRKATLSIQAGTCELLPPKNVPLEVSPCQVNVVRVEEIEREENPISWVLLTTEPVKDFEGALKVIEFYRCRWKIEEWHKALKTGCRIEERQLEKWERMEVLLSIYSIIAWKVLELREIARGEEIPPEEFLTDVEIALLEKKFPELKGKGGKEYAIAIAKIGGYLDRSSDPPPEWIVMWRGFKEVQTWVEGIKILSPKTI
ncbi:transposase [candidate division MSBL1 archaeon SCGC-AAA261G05]|uniref:Transposase n=1 Tax=candidate division MSBL1 archaeon SCGC-AAA261G05 TaxID=1698276 RepID=A0A133VAV5_9EURY|nr:transposase [candidate division MSBL1 archaeon SCGC-AAA261G05]